MNSNSSVKAWTYLGLFFVSLSTLMYEVLLTRIFSVTMWYHFAFMAISIAMFGMTVGAIIVYIFPKLFAQEKTKYHLAINSGLFGLSIIITFLLYLAIPFTTPGSTEALLSRFGTLIRIYLIISIPFVFSGITVCLALTKFSKQVSKLYAADLIGAASGCILLIQTLNVVSGPVAVTIIAVLAGIGSVFFALDINKKWIKIFSLSCLAVLVLFVFNNIKTGDEKQLLKIQWVKGGKETRTIYEKWNSFSRINVWGNPNELVQPFGWGLSPLYPQNQKIKQLWLLIDATAGTPLTGFSGDLKDAEFLKYDIVNLVHYIRPQSKVLVVGSGGGRDILSALVFNQPSVVGVEVNENIINAVNKQFGDFTGHLDSNPKVKFINDEARSYVSRTKESFDIIQVSLIDSWAATAAGAFVLTENSLYTVEAWKTFLDHLTPNGILTFSRWYFKDRPGEVYRLASLAAEALGQMGVKNPREHIVISRRMGEFENPNAPDGVGTILINKQPFSQEDLSKLKEVIGQMKFDLVLSPDYSLDPVFENILNDTSNVFKKQFPINIIAPTDDSPFFFYMTKIKNIFDKQLWNQGKTSFNIAAVAVLFILLFVTIVLTLGFILLPVVLTASVRPLHLSLPLIIYFASIGLAFMLIEVSQMQRLIIFLGHPTYSLSVLLFSLLLFSGIGSFLTNKIRDNEVLSAIPKRLIILMFILVIFGFLTPALTEALQGAHTSIRIICTVLMLAPLAVFMGMIFPLGMKVASVKMNNITPLLWGTNGATSVVASVLSVVVALSASISAAFWLGFLFYAIALASIIWFKYLTKNPSYN